MSRTMEWTAQEYLDRRERYWEVREEVRVLGMVNIVSPMRTLFTLSHMSYRGEVEPRVSCVEVLPVWVRIPLLVEYGAVEWIRSREVGDPESAVSSYSYWMLGKRVTSGRFGWGAVLDCDLPFYEGLW